MADLGTSCVSRDCWRQRFGCTVPASIWLTLTADERESHDHWRGRVWSSRRVSAVRMLSPELKIFGWVSARTRKAFQLHEVDACTEYGVGCSNAQARQGG